MSRRGTVMAEPGMGPDRQEFLPTYLSYTHRLGNRNGGRPLPPLAMTAQKPVPPRLIVAGT